MLVEFPFRTVRPTRYGAHMDALRKLLFDDGKAWLHVAALVAIAIGVVDLWAFRRIPEGVDLTLILDGLAAMGLNATFKMGRSRAPAPPAH